MPNVIGDLGDPQKDAAALSPVLEQLQTSLGVDLVHNVIPAFMAGLTALLQGQKMTITVSVEPKAAAAVTPAP
jgi:hypothetical protein